MPSRGGLETVALHKRHSRATCQVPKALRWCEEVREFLAKIKMLCCCYWWSVPGSCSEALLCCRLEMCWLSFDERLCISAVQMDLGAGLKEK